MIVAFSTSSPIASVALIVAESGTPHVVWSGREEAQGRASGACLRMLDRGLRELAVGFESLEGFVADTGPGSFTGVRVGVTLAKAFAFALGVRAAGVSAFDLIDPVGAAAVPNRKGEWLVRWVGSEPALWRLGDPLPGLGSAEDLGSVVRGYGAGFDPTAHPDAARVCESWGSLDWVEPERLLPDYRSGPSISRPKRPYTAPHPRGEPLG